MSFLLGCADTGSAFVTLAPLGLVLPIWSVPIPRWRGLAGLIVTLGMDCEESACNNGVPTACLIRSIRDLLPLVLTTSRNLNSAGKLAGLLADLRRWPSVQRRTASESPLATMFWILPP